jgi:hypothetical protein
MGGQYLIGLDFNGPDKQDSEVQISLMQKSKNMAAYLAHISHLSHFTKINDMEAQQSKTSGSKQEKIIHSSDLYHEELTDVKSDVGQTQPVEPSNSEADHTTHQNSTSHCPPTPKLPVRIFRKIAAMLQIALSVPTTIVVIAFIISVIPALKGLFVLSSSSPTAPDGQPPLAFILDTATFLGGASVPLGLIGLGSALARINIPRNDWGKLPFGSIMGLALGRMVLQPVLGILIVRGLTNVGLISKDDKVLQFVAM